MKVFDESKAEEIVTDQIVLSRAGPMTLVFCKLTCKIDWHNGVVRRTEIADRHLYGCWQCGEDLLQGMLLDGELGDDNLYRQRRLEG